MTTDISGLAPILEVEYSQSFFVAACCYEILGGGNINAADDVLMRKSLKGFSGVCIP
jgi:hypothetical protein